MLIQLILLGAVFLPLITVPDTTQATAPGYHTGFARWRAADNAFAAWQLQGVRRADDGSVALDPAAATRESDPFAAGSYHGGNFYNGGSYQVGQATSPEWSTPFAFAEAIGSWNASTPAGSWVETLIRARVGSHWSTWYNLGVWASDESTVARHSVTQQRDADGTVSTDTWVRGANAADATAFQLRVRLFRAADGAVPSVRAVSLAYSPAKPATPQPSSGDTTLWNTVLNVPTCSQMVYADGGEVWCSPTSTSMVLGYWAKSTGPCEPRVRAAVAGVYDRVYDGHGNWPFNTAYAASTGLEGYVARFASLAQAEPWINAGVPLIVSIAWNHNLDGAPFGSSSGHLMVLVGFDAQGNPVVNDPAAPDNGSVRRTYNRAQFEARWLAASGGAVYLIYPQGSPVPALP